MSGEMQDKYVEDLERALMNLINAAKPLASYDVVDELTATIPLVESLEEAINQSKELLLGEA